MALREVPWGRGCEAFEQNLASVSPEWRRSLTPADEKTQGPVKQMGNSSPSLLV